MAQAEDGKTVKVHYTGKLDDGTVFDSSRDRDPMSFTLGNQEVIPGFENAIKEMSEGESKTVTVSSDDAYGPYVEDRKLDVSLSQFPDDITPEVGQVLQMMHQSGQTIHVRVDAINDDTATLDANHPLAGKDLTFEIELLEIA